MIQRIFTHWKTSVFGTLSGVVWWWYMQGFKVPETKQEWAATAGGILMVLLGLGVKDPGRKPPTHEDANAEQ